VSYSNGLLGWSGEVASSVAGVGFKLTAGGNFD